MVSLPFVKIEEEPGDVFREICGNAIGIMGFLVGEEFSLFDAAITNYLEDECVNHVLRAIRVAEFLVYGAN